MLSLTEKCKFLAKSNEKAIVLCNEQKVLESKTYEEVISISKIITKMVSKHITEHHICMGLLMDHNVHVPSIIFSLQRLKCAFVFITAKNLDKIITNLKINWILSLEDTKEISLFQQIHKISIDEKNNLLLWRRSILQSTDTNYVDIFCVVQTSGSTGEYKTIKVTNSCIELNASSLRQIFGIYSKDIIYWGTPLTFDPSIIELLIALQSGACLVIVPYNVSVNPHLLYNVLFNVCHITFLQMVPSVFLRWNETQIKHILLNAKLRILAFGGETFPKVTLRYERGSHLRVFNLYGISEVSCWATVYEIKDETCDDDIPIGTNLSATLLELRNEQGEVVDSGNGEIFIGSSSRICYVNDETPEGICGTVFRETGDIAEATDKGMFLIGRKNKIIKRFGHRINLSRLETSIFKETGLENKCVWSKERNKISTFILIRNLDKRLKDKTLDKLRIKLINVLPEESFPDFIDIVENFPLTLHGKIDEKALVQLYAIPNTTLNDADVFSQLWCKYAGVSTESFEQVKRCKFFETGGNSISATQMLTEFRELVHSEYPEELVRMIFENTLQDCLTFLEICKPVRKRSHETVAGNIRKKGKVSNELKIIWSYDLKACVDASPVVFEKDGLVHVLVGSFSHIFAIFKDSGENIVKMVLPNPIESTPSISPCGNFILVGCFNGLMYCIGFKEKEIIWEYSTGGKIKSSACFCRGQSAAVFGSYDNRIHCVSLETGSKLWDTLLDGSVASNLVHDEPNRLIFTATTCGTCVCLNEDTGALTWEYNCGGPIFGTPCFLDKKESIVFPAVQGILHCLRSESGEKLWTFRVDGYIFSSVIFYKDLLLFGCHDKNVYITKVSSLSCEVVSKVALGSEISTTPFVCDVNGNDVIVSACNSGVIYVIDLKTYCILSSAQLPGEVFSSPFVYNGRIYVGCRDNNLYCIEVDDKIKVR